MESGVNMTDEEFLRLKIGTVVSWRFDKDTYYVVNQEDIFGNGNYTLDRMTFGARELGGMRQIRISKNNASYWSVQGRIKEG